MISVYSDGSSSGRNDKPGGYGWIVLRDGEPLAAGYGGDPSTTNNRMEMLGAIKGLEALRALNLDLSESLVELVSDSEYTLGMGSGSFSPTKNLDLVERLKAVCAEMKVRFRWVRGHSKETWNERADALAKMGKEEAKASLREARDGAG